MRLLLGLLVFRVLIRFKLLHIMTGRRDAVLRLRILACEVALLTIVIVISIFAGRTGFLIYALLRRILTLARILIRRRRATSLTLLITVALFAKRDLIETISYLRAFHRKVVKSNRVIIRGRD
jgi:hypothetical protein